MKRNYLVKSSKMFNSNEKLIIKKFKIPQSFVKSVIKRCE